ncbi:MAG: murein transglycosylase A [Alphaproteobacteria bacterium]
MPDTVVYRPVSFEALPGWHEDALEEVLPAFQRSCGVLSKQPGDRTLGPAGAAGPVRRWQAVCRAAASLGPVSRQTIQTFFETWFLPAEVLFRNSSTGIFTGYYEAEFKGSLKPSGTYRTPVYGRPGDLVTVDLSLFREEWKHESIVGRLDGGRLKRYPDRAAIDAGELSGIAPPILWVADPVDVFLLHIQGSARVRLDDGGTVRLRYAADNGRKFVGIVRTMVNRGLIPQDSQSMEVVTRWLREHPGQAPEIMAENPRYIFFQLLNGEGPIGAQGVALTPGRSLAVDPRYIPLGAPLWLDTTTPDGGRLRRLVMAQDTGNAITGAVRGDYFWGTGEKAFHSAGRMKSSGRYFILLPRDS